MSAKSPYRVLCIKEPIRENERRARYCVTTAEESVCYPKKDVQNLWQESLSPKSLGKERRTIHAVKEARVVCHMRYGENGVKSLMQCRCMKAARKRRVILE